MNDTTFKKDMYTYKFVGPYIQYLKYTIEFNLKIFDEIIYLFTKKLNWCLLI